MKANNIVILTVLSPLIVILLLLFVYDVQFTREYSNIVLKDFIGNGLRLIKKDKSKLNVWKGEDGWLFYSGEISANLLRWRYNTHNAAVLKKLIDTLRSQNIETIIVPVPNKIDIYPEKCLPTGSEIMVRKKRGRFFSNFNDRHLVVDLYDDFVAAKDSVLLYYKTDTHWNTNAKLIASEKICNLIKYRNFRKIELTLRMKDTVLFHETDLLNNLLKDTTLTHSKVVSVRDEFGNVRKNTLNSDIAIIGDSFGRNENAIGADIGSYISYKLNANVNLYTTSAVKGADFFKYVKRTILKLHNKPKVVIIVISSRKLIWKIDDR